MSDEGIPSRPSMQKVLLPETTWTYPRMRAASRPIASAERGDMRMANVQIQEAAWRSGGGSRCRFHSMAEGAQSIGTWREYGETNSPEDYDQ